MSDGGENGRESEQHKTKRKFGRNEFVPAIAKIAVAQICESEGFQGFQQSALETLSDVAVRYIRDLGKTAHFHANLAGRTECNVFDIVRGLEDLASPQGFLGASDINHCLASSGTIREITHYIGVAEEVPFVYDVPQFPVVKDRKPALSFLQIGEEPPGEHIPAWLPAFPDLHTYVYSPTQNERATDSHIDKIELERQHRKEESSVLNLQQHLACNGSEGPSSVEHGDPAKAKQAMESNPFLAAPLRFGEKEVSPIVFPPTISNEAVVEYPVSKHYAEENHVSVLDTFAPAIEAMKNKSCDSEDGGEKVLLNQRPTVRFKIGIGEKNSGSNVDLSLQKKSVQKIPSWFGKDNGKDDKKRRAEQILKESMENPHELAQL